LGILHSTYAAIDVMSKEKGGHGGVIVNVSSVAGLNTTTWMPAYSAAKHGIVGLNRSFGVSKISKQKAVPHLYTFLLAGPALLRQIWHKIHNNLSWCNANIHYR